jgi:CheY-like chemotaxis protein
VRADICIVAAGIAGMTTAYLLTRAAASAGKDQGATFVVRLPVSPVYHFDAAEGRIHPGTQHLLMPLDQSERLDEMKLLIVDDEQDTRDLLQTALSECGAITTVAASADDGFQQLISNPPDVLISDIGMPNQDGYEFIRRVRALPTDQGGKVPAVALTAYARIEDRLKALRAGYEMHVPKPVELTELVAVILSLVRREK